MALSQVSPGRYVVQVFRSDPLGGKPLRLCKRVRGLAVAEKQDQEFATEADNWVARQSLIKEAGQRGVELASPSSPDSVPGFSDYLEQVFLPWARQNLDPRTIEARAGTYRILADDLENTRLDEVDRHVDRLIEKWRAEGVRYTSDTDRLGRKLNRKPRALTDAGLSERIKVLRGALFHAYRRARLLVLPPRIASIKVKRAAPGAGTPVRYYTDSERVRFHRHNPRQDVRDLFEVGRMLGLRPGEIFHMLVGWIDFRQRKVIVQASPCALCKGGTWTPKMGGYRAVDIAPELAPILRRLVKGKPDSALVFDTTHGAPLSRLRGSGGAFVKGLRRAGLGRKGLSIYSLRHSFAADLVSAGRPMQEVAALLGNSVRVCEMHYGHLMPGRTAHAVQVLRAVQPWGQAEAPVAPPSVTSPLAVTSRTKRAA